MLNLYFLFGQQTRTLQNRTIIRYPWSDRPKSEHILDFLSPCEKAATKQRAVRACRANEQSMTQRDSRQKQTGFFPPKALQVRDVKHPSQLDALVARHPQKKLFFLRRLGRNGIIRGSKSDQKGFICLHTDK